MLKARAVPPLQDELNFADEVQYSTRPRPTVTGPAGRMKNFLSNSMQQFISPYQLAKIDCLAAAVSLNGDCFLVMIIQAVTARQLLEDEDSGFLVSRDHRRWKERLSIYASPWTVTTYQ